MNKERLLDRYDELVRQVQVETMQEGGLVTEEFKLLVHRVAIDALSRDHRFGPARRMLRRLVTGRFERSLERGCTDDLQAIFVHTGRLFQRVVIKP